jgi:hypothetical protein
MLRTRWIVSILVTSLFQLFFVVGVAKAQVKTSIDVMGLSFISSDFDSPDKNTFGFIGASLKSNTKNPETFMINASAFYATGNAVLSYINFREIYFTVPSDTNTKTHIGRKLKSWSALDQDWNLGFFEPQFRWNPLSPENQGLTGVFWDHEENSWGLSLFASPLYLPDQGPGYEVKDGQFQNSNPWFNKPPQNIKFQGQIFPIDYNIHTPEISDVIYHSIYAAQFNLGKKTGFFSSVSAAYKPANIFALGYTGVIVTTRAKVDVTPKLYDENDYSGDFGYRDSWGLAQISVLYSKPQVVHFESTVSNTPTIDESVSWGPRFNYNLTSSLQLGVAYLDTSGGKVSEQGPDASADRPALTQRFLYRQAVQVQAKYSDVFKHVLKVDSVLQYTQSSKDQFQQIRFTNKFDIKGPWSFSSDLILIETADDSTLNMNAYRNLDQFWIGVSYDI